MLLNIYELFMSSYWSLLILILTSIACAIIGTFLVLRNLSMLSDAISHTILLGIVLAYFITRDISSPLLIIGAGLFGVITIFFTEVLSSTGLVKSDDSVGIVFPLFFSIAVLLITKYARNTHLDIDIILTGEVILAPLNTFNIFGYELPKAFVQMIVIIVINLIFVTVYYKELKITTFDKEFSIIAGFSPILLFYSLMTLSSVTAVIAFDAVGAILVISFLITPPASSYLITKKLNMTIIVAIVYSIFNSIVGYFLAIIYNVSISGMTATVAGVTFILTVVFNKNGIITSCILRYKRRKQMYEDLLIVHIGNHLEDKDIDSELGINSIYLHLNWKEEEFLKVAHKLEVKKDIFIEKDRYKLTEKGLKRYECLYKTYIL